MVGVAWLTVNAWFTTRAALWSVAIEKPLHDRPFGDVRECRVPEGGGPTGKTSTSSLVASNVKYDVSAPMTGRPGDQ
jgi:hypothetical protein